MTVNLFSAGRYGLSSRAAMLGFIVSSLTPQLVTDAWSATQTEILQTCESCHGMRGDSQVTNTPRLNGQRAEYMVERLKTFSTVVRTDPHAKVGMLKELAPESYAAQGSIATYFANQTPTRPQPGVRAAEGKHIYENGIAAENVIACNQCHGAQGEGHGLAPRIAGQHADYLRAQLRLFNLKFRDHELMKPNTKTMTAKTMEALISFLAND